MGCAGSRSALHLKDSPLNEALERTLIEEIMTTKRRKSFLAKKSSFNNLMLQMPKLTIGFKKIRQAHATIGGPSGKVTWATFRSVCPEKLGLDPNSESLREVLSLPDVADGVLVTHPDLILIYTVVFLLDSNTRRHSFTSTEICACLDLMEKSFMFFDSSADGRIERKELAHAMKSGTRVFGRKTSKTLADQLFDQLDWSRDGQITFKEFLIGMERIIIETAGDEEDEPGQDEEDCQDVDADSDGDEVKQEEVPQQPPPPPPPPAGPVTPSQPPPQRQETVETEDLAQEQKQSEEQSEQQQLEGQLQQATKPLSLLEAPQLPPLPPLGKGAGASDEVRPFTLSTTGAI